MTSGNDQKGKIFESGTTERMTLKNMQPGSYRACIEIPGDVTRLEEDRILLDEPKITLELKAPELSDRSWQTTTGVPQDFQFQIVTGTGEFSGFETVFWVFDGLDCAPSPPSLSGQPGVTSHQHQHNACTCGNTPVHATPARRAITPTQRARVCAHTSTCKRIHAHICSPLCWLAQ